jgi:DNA-binding response OmpR family regulator
VPPPTAFVFDRQRIVVADEDSVVVAFIIDTLRADGHYVTHSYDALSAIQDLALHECHLLISSTRVDGVAGIDLIDELRERRPALPLLYLADVESTPELEAQLPADVPILSEPFTAEQLQAAVRPLLPQLRIGSTLALKGTPGENRGRKATGPRLLRDAALWDGRRHVRRRTQLECITADSQPLQATRRGLVHLPTGAGVIPCQCSTAFPATASALLLGTLGRSDEATPPGGPSAVTPPEAARPAPARTASTSRSRVQVNGTRVDAFLTSTDPSGCLLQATEPRLVAPHADTVKVINNDA